MKITKIKPKSLAKVMGAVYVVIGLVLGIFFAAGAPFSSDVPSPAWMYGMGAVIILPIVYGIMGLILGWFVAVVYNTVSKKFGGVEIETE